MKIVAIILCLALPAMAQEKSPLCLTPEQEIRLAQRLKGQQAQIESLKKDAGIPVPFVVALIVGSIALGVGATVGAYELSKQPAK